MGTMYFLFDTHKYQTEPNDVSSALKWAFGFEVIVYKLALQVRAQYLFLVRGFTGVAISVDVCIPDHHVKLFFITEVAINFQI